MFISMYVDEFGEPVENTPIDCPYSHDDYMIWRGGKNEEANYTVYTDRLIRDSKYNELSMKHFGDRGHVFYQRSPKDIESFLREWYDKENLKLIYIVQSVNHWNGYPLWRLAINI